MAEVTRTTQAGAVVVMSQDPTIYVTQAGFMVLAKEGAEPVAGGTATKSGPGTLRTGIHL